MGISEKRIRRSRIGPHFEVAGYSKKEGTWVNKRHKDVEGYLARIELIELAVGHTETPLQALLKRATLKTKVIENQSDDQKNVQSDDQKKET